MITPAGIAGMAQALEHAEGVAPGWGERAYQAIAGNQWLAYGHPWTIEEARALVALEGLDEAVSLRAWGPVTTKLLRDGIIEPVGYAPAASSHGSPKRTYRLTLRAPSRN